MLRVITWLWSQPNYRSKFEACHVNTLFNMVSRNLSLPFEFVCLTNTPAGIRSEVRILPLPEVGRIPVPDGRPNCFRRLWAFSDQAREKIGERFVSMDLDCVVTGDLTPLFDRPDEFVMWGDTARRTQYNGSLWLMRAGSRRQVWDDFIRDPRAAWTNVKRSGMIGSDQAWISKTLGQGEAMWTERDGVYSFRNNIAMRRKRDLPDNARVVFFHGIPDPWDKSVQRDYPWIREHYQ